MKFSLTEAFIDKYETSQKFMDIFSKAFILGKFAVHN